MHETHPPEHQQRHRIVVPSRSDPILSKLTEVAGGPLGRRTAPGIVDPGFFSVERVLILMVMASAIVAMLFKYHCAQAGWTTPDQYSTACWSQIPNAFTGERLGTLFPYFSHNAFFDYPPLAGMVAGVTSWLTSPAGNGPGRVLAFFDINAALIAAAWIVSVVAVARSARRRPWDAAIVAVSPILFLTAYTNWDFWAVALVAVGILLFSRRRTLWAGLVLGLAAGVAPYALLVVVALVIVAVRAGKVMPVLECAAAAAVGWMAVVGPVVLINPQTWGAYIGGVVTSAPSDSSLYGGYNLVMQRLGGPLLSVAAINVLAVALFLICAALIVWLSMAAKRRPRVAQVAFLLVTALVVTSKSTQPWDILWLLPLLALAHPRWRAAILWQATAIAHYLAWLLFQSKVLGNISAQHTIDMPYFVLAAMIYMVATVLVAWTVVRDVLDPSFDVVRRAGADDPQGGLLEGAPDPARAVRAAPLPLNGGSGEDASSPAQGETSR